MLPLAHSGLGRQALHRKRHMSICRWHWLQELFHVPSLCVLVFPVVVKITLRSPLTSYSISQSDEEEYDDDDNNDVEEDEDEFEEEPEVKNGVKRKFS